MIDFVKFHVPIRYKVFISKVLDVYDSVCLETGEIAKVEAKYKNFTFIFRSSHIEIKGSFHTLFNDGLHNYNDFSFFNATITIIDFCQKFRIPLDECILKNVEIGFNIKPSISTTDLLDSILLSQNKPPLMVRNHEKHFLEFKNQRYFLKIYDKGLQNHKLYNILRVEKKDMKMQELKYASIISLKDLLIQSNIEWLIERLFSCFEKVLMYDDTLRLESVNSNSKARIKEIEILKNGCNPMYWIKQKKLLKPTTFYKKLNKFKSLRDQYKQNKNHFLILSLLKEKSIEMLN